MADVSTGIEHPVRPDLFLSSRQYVDEMDAMIEVLKGIEIDAERQYGAWVGERHPNTVNPSCDGADRAIADALAMALQGVRAEPHWYSPTTAFPVMQWELLIEDVRAYVAFGRHDALLGRDFHRRDAHATRMSGHRRLLALYE